VLLEISLDQVNYVISIKCNAGHGDRQKETRSKTMVDYTKHKQIKTLTTRLVESCTTDPKEWAAAAQFLGCNLPIRIAVECCMVDPADTEGVLNRWFVDLMMEKQDHETDVAMHFVSRLLNLH